MIKQTPTDDRSTNPSQ